MRLFIVGLLRLLGKYGPQQILTGGFSAFSEVEHEFGAKVANAIVPRVAMGEQVGGHLAKAIRLIQGNGPTQTIAQAHIGGIDAEALVVGVPHLRRGVHEDGGLEGRKAELAENRRPVCHQNVGLENGVVAAEVALEGKLLAGHVGVAALERVPSGPETLDVLGMRADDDLVATTEG